MHIGAPKKSEQTGCQHIQFTELVKKELEDKNSPENHKVLGTKKSGFKIPNSFSELCLPCLVVSTESLT